MSEYDDLVPEDPTRSGIEYVDEQGKPEEGESLPPLMTAADLLPDDDPVAALPSEPPDEDTPPESATPPFIIMPRPGRSPSVYLANGIPVGVWLDEEHHSLDGGQVAEMLVLMGMDGALAAWYGIQRDGRIEADKVLADDPRVQAFAEEEEHRFTQKKAIQEAFVKAQAKKT